MSFFSLQMIILRSRMRMLLGRARRRFGMRRHRVVEPPAQPVRLSAGALRQLYEGLAALQRGEFAGALQEYRETGRDPQAVDDLRIALARSGLALDDFEGVTWPNNERYGLEPERLRSAGLDEVRKVATSMLQGERFVGGAFPALCAGGTMTLLLGRVKEIVETGTERIEIVDELVSDPGERTDGPPRS